MKQKLPVLEFVITKYQYVSRLKEICMNLIEFFCASSLYHTIPSSFDDNRITNIVQ